jgi:hypothetical protein
LKWKRVHGYVRNPDGWDPPQGGSKADS